MRTSGWYDDPEDSTRLRYWNGQKWTDSFAKRPESAPSRRSEEPAESVPPPERPPVGKSPEAATVDDARLGLTGPEPLEPSELEGLEPGSGHTGGDGSVRRPSDTPKSSAESSTPPPPSGPGSGGVTDSWSEIWDDILAVAEDRLPPAVTRSPGSLVGSGVAVLVVLAGLVFVGYQALNGPSTRPELCSAYQTFADEWFAFSLGDGRFDSDAFDAMEDLGGVAKRYPNNPGVQANGASLKRLADGDGGYIVSVSVFEAENASRNIARECL